jgi:hypothetical protein
MGEWTTRFLQYAASTLLIILLDARYKSHRPDTNATISGKISTIFETYKGAPLGPPDSRLWSRAGEDRFGSLPAALGTCRYRPTADFGASDLRAPEQPLAACGKLTLTLDESNGNTGSTRL